MSQNIAEANIRITVDDKGKIVVKQFGDETEKAAKKSSKAWSDSGRSLKDYNEKLSGMHGNLMKIVGVMGTLVAGGMVTRWIGEQMDLADAIGKTADKLGLSTDALQEYRYAAGLSGVATNALDMGLQRLTRRLAEARTGKGELLSTLQLYNIALYDGQGRVRSMEQVLADLADVIATTEDESERLRIAFKAFDSEGVAMVNMLKNGSGALKDVRDRARELGVVLDEQVIRNSEQANDNLSTLGQVVRTQLMSAVGDFLPDLITMTQKTIEWVGHNREFINLKVHEYMGKVRDAGKQIWDVISYDPAIIEYGLLGLFLGGRKGAIVLGGMAHMASWASNLGKAAGMAAEGVIEWTDILGANYGELEALVKKGEALLEATEKSGNDAARTPEGRLKINIGSPGSYRPLTVIEDTLNDAQYEIDETSAKYAEMARKIREESLVTHDYLLLMGEDIVEGTEERFARLEQLSERTATAMEGNFSTLFFDMMRWEFDSMEDYALNMLRSLQQVTADVLAEMWADILGSTGEGSGGWLSSVADWVYDMFSGWGSLDGILAGIFHGGGVAGKTAVPQVIAPAALFDGAKRLHLGTDEYPAILKKGEQVIDEGSGGIGVHVSIENKGADKEVESSTARFDGEKWVIGIMLKDAATNGPYRRALGM